MLTPSVFGGPAAAQAPGPAPVQTTPVPTPDADQLAAAMRRVGENPRDVQALLTAGELSLRLGDAGGAASLFKRAEAIEPMNGRVRAGMARILVTQESAISTRRSDSVSIRAPLRATGGWPLT
jgi:cytochrome c-type biogenesis protein CcmH/NrfG